MKITIDSIAKATRKLALENKETSKQLNEDDDWLSLFADDEEPETPEKDEPKEEEPKEDEPKAEDEPEDKPSLDALKDASIKADDDEELELGTASDEDQDLDDEDTVLDLGSGKEDEPADEPAADEPAEEPEVKDDEPEAEEPKDEEPAGDELEVVDEPADDEDDEDMEPDADELEDDEEDDEDDEDDEIELETTDGEGEDLFKDGPADALKSVGIDDPEKADPEDLAAAKALLGTDGEEEKKVDEGEDGLHTFILHIRDKQTHKFDHVAIKAADKDEAIRKFWEDPLYNNPDKAPSVFSVDCKDCDEAPILSVEDDEQKQSHSYCAYFDTSVPVELTCAGVKFDTDGGDEFAVGQMSQILEFDFDDAAIENVTKDGEDWYDEFNEILQDLMAKDAVYDNDVEVDWEEIESDDDEDDDDEDDEEEADESYDVTDDEDDEDVPPGTGRNPNKAWGYSSMKDRRRDRSDKHGAAKGPRDRKFKPRREFELTNESDVHEVKGAAQIYRFLKECNTYKHSKTLRESVAKFVNIARKSPKKVKQIAEALDKRFTGKTVSERSFAAAFVGMVK